jgi:hypothetical protein
MDTVFVVPVILTIGIPILLIIMRWCCCASNSTEETDQEQRQNRLQQQQQQQRQQHSGEVFSIYPIKPELDPPPSYESVMGQQSHGTETC